MEGEIGDDIADPIDGPENDQVAEDFRLGLAAGFLMGFLPPRAVLRSDPVVISEANEVICQSLLELLHSAVSV